MIPLLADPAEFADLVQRFFAERLLQQQAVSPRTVAAYRDTFRLLLGYAERQLGKPPAKLVLEDVDAELILASWLTSKPSVTTRCVAAMRGSLRSGPLPGTSQSSARRPCCSSSASWPSR